MHDVNQMNTYMVMTKLLQVCGYQTMLKMRSLELTPGKAGIIFTLHHYGPLSQREVAERVHIKPSSMTVALRKLEERSLIRRTEDKKDKRVIIVSITESGEQLINRIKAVMQELDEMLIADMSAEEAVLFRRLLLQAYATMTQATEMKPGSMDEIMHELHHLHH